MDERDELILSLAFVLKKHRLALQQLKTIGDSQRAATLIVDEFKRRNYRIEGVKVETPGHSTP